MKTDEEVLNIGSEDLDQIPTMSPTTSVSKVMHRSLSTYFIICKVGLIISIIAISHACLSIGMKQSS